MHLAFNLNRYWLTNAPTCALAIGYMSILNYSMQQPSFNLLLSMVACTHNFWALIMPCSMCKSLNVQAFTDVGSRLSTWAWACVLHRVLCAAWVRECCVRPCVRVSVACCMHACMHGAYSLPLTCSYFKLPLFPPYGDTPSVPKYGVKASLCSQIRSICLSTDFNKWLGTEQNEWSERRGIGIM